MTSVATSVPIDNDQAFEVAIAGFRQKAKAVLAQMASEGFYGSLRLEVFGHGTELTGFESSVQDSVKFARSRKKTA